MDVIVNVATREGRAYPLCIDLDGTLVPGDTLLETTLLLLHRNPAYLFALLVWACRGRAYLKQQVAQRVEIDAAYWPYRPDVVEYVRREKARGRTIALATASDRRIADAVAAHLGLFGAVLASDGSVNLKGRAKAEALTARYGRRGYVYAGDSRADLPVWESAAAGVVVGRSQAFAERVARLAPIERRLGIGRMRSIAAVTRLMRPHQWVKNLLLLVPLMTAHRLSDPTAVLAEARAIVAVCLASSAVYIFNDLVDIHADRMHPRKRDRPLASGVVNAWLAMPLAALLALTSAIVAWPLPRLFGIGLCTYVAAACLYSLFWKRMPGIDVLALAGLYALRVVLGAAAIDVPASNWLIAFAACLFTSLALLKRFVELDGAARDGRDVGRWRGYDVQHRDAVARMGGVSGALAVVVIGAFAFSSEAGTYYRSPLTLLLLAPLVAVWLWHVWRIAKRGRMRDDPIQFAVRDLSSYAVLVAMIATTEIAALLPSTN